MALPQPVFTYRPVGEGGIRIVFNEVHKTNSTEENFTGGVPVDGLTPDTPQHGSIVYEPSEESGLFKFQVGATYGANPLDWIRIIRVIPYIQLGTITAFTVSIIPPETALGGVTYPDAQVVSTLAEYTNGGMEKMYHLANSSLRLRPGSQLKITTAGATAVQMCEVWWERERQLRPNEHGNEIFAYGV